MKVTGAEHHRWRLQTNFAEPKDIMVCFGAWPDSVLSPEYLHELYSGTTTVAHSPFAFSSEQGIRPAFPFLEASEGERIASLWRSQKEKVYPQVRAMFSRGPLASRDDRCNPAAGCVLLALQTLAILELREREREVGLWDRRTEAQKVGTLFAVRPYEAVFTRVEAIPFGENRFLCVPWGGPFEAYAEILELLEDPYTAQMLATASEEMEIIPDGRVVKQLTRAGFVREVRKGLFSTKFEIGVPAVGDQEIRDTALAILPAVRGLSNAIVEVLPQLKTLAESGRYSYLAGIGDYMEMGYSVLMGLILEWAIEDGLLGRPPQYKVVRGDRGIREVSIDGRRRGAPAHLPGVVIVRDGYVAWDELLATARVPE